MEVGEEHEGVFGERVEGREGLQRLQGAPARSVAGVDEAARGGPGVERTPEFGGDGLQLRLDAGLLVARDGDARMSRADVVCDFRFHVVPVGRG